MLQLDFHHSMLFTKCKTGRSKLMGEAGRVFGKMRRQVGSTCWKDTLGSTVVQSGLVTNFRSIYGKAFEEAFPEEAPWYKTRAQMLW